MMMKRARLLKLKVDYLIDVLMMHCYSFHKYNEEWKIKLFSKTLKVRTYPMQKRILFLKRPFLSGLLFGVCRLVIVHSFGIVMVCIPFLGFPIVVSIC